MRYILRIIISEYRAILSDSGVMLIFIAGLAIYSGFYPVPYSPEVLKELAVVPVDLDHSALSRKLMRWAEATEEVRFVEPSGNLSDARQQVLNEEASGVFVIPKGFERDILRGEQAVVSIYADASYFLIYRQIMTGLFKATATLSAGVEIRRFTAAGQGEEHAMRSRDPLPLVSRPLFNPASGYATYVVPGVLILIMQQTLLIGIGMLGGTRNEEFRKAPAPPQGDTESYLAILLGRGFAYFSIYIAYPIFYQAVIFRVYDLPRSHDLGSGLLFLAPFVLSVVFLGFTLNSVFHSRELSIPAIMFTSMPAVFFIGFAWPVDAIPHWLRNVSLLLPSTAGVAGFIRVNQMGASLREVGFEWSVLWGLCFLYFILAWVTMHRTHDPSDQTPTLY